MNEENPLFSDEYDYYEYLNQKLEEKDKHTKDPSELMTDSSCQTQ